MKSTKPLVILFLVFISSSIFAQKVHYKDSYYTIIKSKIFHRGHDVFGRLSPGLKDTIYIIAEELYDKRGKLKEQYKNTKKRDRYKLPESFWEEREALAAQSKTTTEEKQSKIIHTTAVQSQNSQTIVIEDDLKNAEQIETAIKENTQKVISSKNTTTQASAKEENNSNDKMSNPQKEKKEVIKEEIEQQKQEKKTLTSESTIKEKQKDEKEQKEIKNKIEGKVQEKKTLVTEYSKEQEKDQQNTQRENNQQSKIAKAEQNRKRKEAKNTTIENKKSIEKTKEIKNFENKKDELKKIEKEQQRKQKVLDAKAAALSTLSASSIAATNSSTDEFSTIYLKVNKEKTTATQSGAVLLFFDVINNSNKDLIILKPNNNMDRRLDFFSNIMEECEDIPITSTDYIVKDIKIKDEDYLTVPANAKIELFINGKYRNWLVCNSDDIILQIQYNPFKNAEQDIELEPNMRKELNKSLKKISPIKIESENIKFKLNKQE